MSRQKVTAIVVAHNEAEHVRKCLKSLLEQSQIPDQLIIVAHNCTDSTAEIAESVLSTQTTIQDWTVDRLSSDDGVVYARMRGFELVKNPVAVCLDADSTMSHNLIKEIVRPFKWEGVVAVGGFTVLYGNLWAWLMSWDFFILKRLYEPGQFYFWGSNFAVLMSSYHQVGGLRPLIGLKQDLRLITWSEDLYLSRKLLEVGRVVFAPKAKVYSLAAKTNWNARKKIQGIDRYKLERYFGSRRKYPLLRLS